MQVRRADICKVPDFPFSAGFAAQAEYGYDKGHPLIRPYYLSTFPVRYYYWKKMELVCSLYEYDPRSVALDIGCGPGIFIPTLASFFKDVIAIDINSDDLEIAKKVCSCLGLNNVTLFHGDMASVPIRKESVDVVFSMDVFEHIENLLPTIDSLYAVMKEGGVLAVSAPTENTFNDLARRSMGFTKPETHYHSSSDIRNMINSKFKILKSKRLFGLPKALSPAEVFLFVKKS